MEPRPSIQQVNFGLIPPGEVKGLSGYELLKRLMEGALPAAPIAKVLQFHVTEVEQGRVVVSGKPALDHYNPLGSVHGGYAATLLDTCMALAIHSKLPAGTSHTTLEFKISFLRALSENTGTVRAEGKVLSVGRRVGTAEGRLVDSENKLYAHGTTTCLIFPL